MDSPGAPPPKQRIAPALDHAAFGNGRVLGLVSPTSAIEWLCLPRFDSPSIFARLLDAEKGGTFRFLHEGREIAGELSYLRNTNVARIHFARGDLAWEVIDFAPRIPEGWGVQVPIQIVRLVRPLAGVPRLCVDFDPRPDYARARAEIRLNTSGVEVLGAAAPLHLVSPCSSGWRSSRRSKASSRLGIPFV